MKHSTDRILTTHAGRLDGPPEYQQLIRSVMAGQEWDPEAQKNTIHRAIAEVIGKQIECGMDVISDGEIGKVGFGQVSYYGRRLTGLTARKLKPGENAFMALHTGERQEFADFYKSLNFMPDVGERAVCSGAIRYIGEQEVARDIADARAGLAGASSKPAEMFMC